MNGGSSLICHVIHVQEKIALVLLCFVKGLKCAECANNFPIVKNLDVLTTNITLSFDNSAIK